MNWAFIPNKPPWDGLFAPGKGTKDFAFINILKIKLALHVVQRMWHHLIGSQMVPEREAQADWYGRVMWDG